MSVLIDRALEKISKLNLSELSGDIFRKNPTTYFELLQYPPVGAMSRPSFPNDSRNLFKRNRNKTRLYIHFPFCTGTCKFCSYTRFPSGNINEYMIAMGNDMDIIRSLRGDPHIDTVFIGGGTPSHMSLGQMDGLFTKIHTTFDLPYNPFSTFEVHPELARDPHRLEKIAILKKYGIGRVSIGAQFFDDVLLEQYNRRHSARDIIAILDICRGFGHVNIDIMFGLPHQTLESWEDTLNKVIASHADSISIYEYWVRSGCALYKRDMRHPELFLSTRDVITMIAMYYIALTEAGFKFWAMDSAFLPDNDVESDTSLLNYFHSDNDVIPIGISGFGMLYGTQFMNYIEMNAYLEAIRAGRQPLWLISKWGNDEICRRDFMFSLRSWGVNIESFRNKYSIDVRNEYKDELNKLAGMHLINIDDKTVSLTFLGKIYSEEVCAFFMSDKVKLALRQNPLGLPANILRRYNYIMNAY